MKKLKITFLLIAIVSCLFLGLSCQDDDIEEQPSFFEIHNLSRVGVVLIDDSEFGNSGEGVFTGTMREFIESPLYITGETYFFDVWTGEDCDEISGYCETYFYCCSEIVTIP